MTLPKKVRIVKVPPIKIQGIKTKLVPFIMESVKWDGKGTYYEPFMGSGVVGFNIAPQSAVFSDTNPHLIQFYKDIQSGKITPSETRHFLTCEGEKLSSSPEGKSSYYYEVRDRFNQSPNSLDFLFLQRSNFNGMIRFNSSGNYNVPFGRKPDRFRPALVTKITNQVAWVQSIMKNRDWEFLCIPFQEAFALMNKGDFTYLDPPYIDRFDSYYEPWDEDSANQLADLAQNGKAGFAFSMWAENEHRKNGHLDRWTKGRLLTFEHFYHLGAKESNRNSMTEALIVSDENVNQSEVHCSIEQMRFA